jgi:hypothetical protein
VTPPNPSKYLYGLYSDTDKICSRSAPVVNYRVEVTCQLFFCWIGAEDVKHTFIYILECKEEGTHVWGSQILDLGHTSDFIHITSVLKYSMFLKAKLAF